MKKPGNETGLINLRTLGVRKREGFDICLRLNLNGKRLQKLRTYMLMFDQFDMISHVAPSLTMGENSDEVFILRFNHIYLNLSTELPII